MIYDILEARLADVGFRPGETLFRETMPAETTHGVFLRTPLAGIPVVEGMENWFKTRFQLVTRHLDPVEGLSYANRAASALTIRSRIDAPASDERGPAHITLFIPESLPVRYPALEGSAYEWSLYFHAAFGFIPKV